MVAMALSLAPMLPGGGPLPDAERVALVAAQPLRYRLGWLPWHLTAASDLLLAWALLRTPWVKRGPAYVQALLTTVAVGFDQYGQYLLVVDGVELARQAAQGLPGGVEAFLRHEARAMPITSAWAAFLYTVGSVAWSWCLASAGAWSRWLTRLSLPLWSGFAVVSLSPLLPVAVRPSASLVAAGNAVAFVGLEAWFWLATGAVRRFARPDAPPPWWARVG